LLQGSALGFGLDAGDPLAGLAFAQGYFHGAAPVVGGVGEAHHQYVAAALGGELEVIVEAVVRVVQVVATGLTRQQRVAVERKNPRLPRVGVQRQKRGGGALGQPEHPLGGGVEVHVGQVDKLGGGG